MKTREMLKLILLCAVLFTALGGVVGFSVGLLAPDFYRVIIRYSEGPHFNPVQVGTGIGIVNGAFVGVAVGVALVVIQTWHLIRTSPRSSDTPAG